MNELQKRLEVQGAVQMLIENFMSNNNVSATMMDDALSKVLNNIKEKVVQEFLISAMNNNSDKEKEENNG